MAEGNGSVWAWLGAMAMAGLREPVGPRPIRSARDAVPKGKSKMKFKGSKAAKKAGRKKKGKRS